MGTSTGDGTLNLTLDTSSPTEFLTFAANQTLNISVETDGTGLYKQFSGHFYVISGKKIVFLSEGWQDCPTILVFQE